MYKRLTEVAGHKVFENYEKSANDLYNMYCEILNKAVEDIDAYEKAKVLDNYYTEKKGVNPEKLMDVRSLIVNEYKEFNPGNEKYFFKSGKNPNRLSQEFVASELAKEGCELISEYKNGQTPIYYMYKGKRYYVKFENWRRRQFRPHLGQFPYAHEWDEYHAYMGHNAK